MSAGRGRGRALPRERPRGLSPGGPWAYRAPAGRWLGGSLRWQRPADPGWCQGSCACAEDA